MRRPDFCKKIAACLSTLCSGGRVGKLDTDSSLVLTKGEGAVARVRRSCSCSRGAADACPPSYKPFLGRYKPAYKLSYKLFEFPYKPYKPLGWGSELIILFKNPPVCRHSREVCSTVCSAASTVAAQFVGNVTRFVG